MNLPPSTFLTFPYESVTNKSEYEATAIHIMRVRAARGDSWPLTYDQYKAARLKQGGDPCGPDQFQHIMKLIPDTVGAIRFCDGWATATRRAMAKL